MYKIDVILSTSSLKWFFRDIIVIAFTGANEVIVAVDLSCMDGFISNLMEVMSADVAAVNWQLANGSPETGRAMTNWTIDGHRY